MSQTYQIGRLARLSGVSVETIRYYESIRLMPRPQRSRGNYRVYSSADLERLSFIRHCRSLDMTTDEIERLLRIRAKPAGDCREVNSLLDEHIAQVGARLTELQSLQAQLRRLRDRCHVEQSVDRCQILAGLATLPLRV